MSTSKKILLIEDDETLLDMYRLRFVKDGYNFLTAERGAVGLELAEKEQPDLILLDIIMPEMDGYQTIAKLKKNPKTKKLRVVMLSNLGQQEEIDRAKELGAEDFFIKADLTPSSLVEKVQQKLGLNSTAGKVANGTAKSALARPNQLGEPSLTGVKVLIVEDNEVIMDMYKLRLQKEGALVTPAGNGAWGLKLATTRPFDIILMDIVMPAFNGLQAIAALKKNPKTAKIPILVFSNSGQEKERAAALKLGVEDYLVKADITPVKLIQEILNCLKKKS